MTKKLKDKILKRANESGMDIDGDLIWVLDKRYYVHIVDKEVTEVK
jgi:hypothetical protein